MQKILPLLALGLALGAGAAHATGENGPTKQQAKMTTCNAEAKGKTGDDRKAFMKDCLSAKPTQQTKMKTCNADAKGMKGDERKAFMSQCLKG
jgi:Spy/CpxP family protein refolding chaperone